MLPINQNSVRICNNDWNKTVSKFDLKNQRMEILISNNKPSPQLSTNKIDQNPGNKPSMWLQRGIMFTALVSILGNVPVSSHLLENHTPQAKSFRIVLDNELNTDQQVDSLSKTSSTNLMLQVGNDSHTMHLDSQDENLNNEEPKELNLPTRAIETYVGHVIADTNGEWQTYKVKSYDNLTNIFHKLGHLKALQTLQKNPSISKVFKDLKKDSIIRAHAVDGDLNEIIITHNNVDSFVINAEKDSFKGHWEKDIFEIRQARVSFTISNGLFFDGRKAGINDNIIKQLVKVFDWDIDFSHDVRVGDKVTAVYEEVFHDGDKVTNRDLLAAEFINKGHSHRAIRYTFNNGKTDFFTPEGREMKRAFIRTPIAHARVSSHFNPGRFHPVLHKIRAHKGTDFAARVGTSVMATGNGKIKFIGNKNGYGRTVIIQHREGYTTLYAHLSRFKKDLKQGDTVIQGDTVGYVGSSGLATGPHLHYEFRLNDQPVNPMTASLPNSMSLSSKELRDFRSEAVNLVLQLNVLHRFAEAEIEINSAFGG